MATKAVKNQSGGTKLTHPVERRKRRLRAYGRRVNNVSINDEQREEPKLLGGITGRGFLPGQSGNPKGRPHTKGLLVALRNKIAEVDSNGVTVETRLVEVLVGEALSGKNRLPAVELIFDRLEGRSSQHIEIADVTADLRNRSDGELQFHLDHNRWPDEQEMLLLETTQGAE